MAQPVNMHQRYPNQPRPDVDVVSAVLTLVENAARPLEKYKIPDNHLVDGLKPHFINAAQGWEDITATRLARELNKLRWDVGFVRGVMPEIRKLAKGETANSLRSADDQLRAMNAQCGDDFAGFFSTLPQPLRVRLGNYSRLFDKDMHDDRAGYAREIAHDVSLIGPFVRAVTDDIVRVAGHHAVIAANMVRENVTLCHIAEQGEQIGPAEMADFNSNLKDMRLHVSTAHKWLSTSLRNATRMEEHCLSIPAPTTRKP